MASNPMMQMLRRVSPQGDEFDSVELNPAYNYLRLSVDGNVIFIASDTSNVDSANVVSVWYSAGREVLRFQNGRLVAAVGLTSEWRSVLLPEMPAWSALAERKEPFRWTRIRDVMPGYHFGVRDDLLLRRIAPPDDSQLKLIDPHALTWFDERMVAQHNNADASSDMFPLARYAVDLRDAKEVVVYGEQCVAAKLCFSWQRWQASAGGKSE
ncbi:MAG: YjbF family lipoprotein [Sideroxydans sp.]|nr:YjbF family lipoprotein [Sideroxydans sp.]